MALTKIKLAAMDANSVDSDQYVDGSIDNAHLADDAVDSDEIAAGAIDTAHIADNQVNGDKLADNIDIAGTLDVTGVATFDTTSTFTGDVTGNGGFTGKRTNDAWHVFRGQNSSGSQTSLITGAGVIDVVSYIKTSNNVWIGDRYANNAGVVLNSYGEVSPTNTGTGSGDYVWRAYNATGPSSLKSSITSSGDAEFVSVTDSKGNVRSIPQNTQGSTYTLVATDAGKHILASGTVTVPQSTFAAGDAVTIVNNTASNLTITSQTTLYNAADGANTNYTLSARGVATILWISSTVAHISGAGLS